MSEVKELIRPQTGSDASAERVAAPEATDAYAEALDAGSLTVIVGDVEASPVSELPFEGEASVDDAVPAPSGADAN